MIPKILLATLRANIQGDPNQNLLFQIDISQSFFGQIQKFQVQKWFEEWRFFMLKVSFSKNGQKLRILSKSTF